MSSSSPSTGGGDDPVLAAFEASIAAEESGATAPVSSRSTAGAGAGSSTTSESSEPRPPRLGATYNVFDGEELLEASIASVRPLVQHVVVVYQTVSNFGTPNPKLMPVLEDLQARGLVDELLPFSPRAFSQEEKKDLVSPKTTGADLGGAAATEVADQFFNEMMKREMGREALVKAGCTHFMCLDTDECYKQDQLTAALETMVKGDYHVGVCRMRFYFRDPRWEMKPMDETNYVAALYKADPDMPFRVACPYPFLLDPTRKLHNATRIYEFPRSALEMHHFSFVRSDIRMKLLNVSNRGNYELESVEAFVHEFEGWNPSKPILHPHPYFKQLFKRVEVVENVFGISVTSAYGDDKRPKCARCGAIGKSRCSRCKKVRYCSGKCQQAHWKIHKASCSP